MHWGETCMPETNPEVTKIKSILAAKYTPTNYQTFPADPGTVPADPMVLAAGNFDEASFQR